MNPKNRAEALMEQLQQANFGMVEMGLYLDTHSCDTAALAAFEQYRDAYLQAVRACGSMVSYLDVHGKWDWALCAWPWEMGG